VSPAAAAILNRDTSLRYAVTFFIAYERGYLIKLSPEPAVI